MLICGANCNIFQLFHRKYQQLIEDLLECINNRNMWVKFRGLRFHLLNPSVITICKKKTKTLRFQGLGSSNTLQLASCHCCWEMTTSSHLLPLPSLSKVSTMTPYTSERCGYTHTHALTRRAVIVPSRHVGKLLLSPLGGNISCGWNNETNKKATQESPCQPLWAL